MEDTDKRIPTVEQWEALAEKINQGGGGGGGIIELTDLDCDWDGSSSPNIKGIQTGLLPSGVYHVTNTSDSAMRLYGATSTSTGPSPIAGYYQELSAGVDTYFIVYSPQSSRRTQTFFFGIYYSDFKIVSQNFSDSTKTTATGGDVNALLNSYGIVDNLTSTSPTSPLSANQGRILNDRIGDLSTLTTTNKTSAVAAINELAGSAGGGDVVVFDTATDTPQDVKTALDAGKTVFVRGPYSSSTYTFHIPYSNLSSYTSSSVILHLPYFDCARLGTISLADVETRVMGLNLRFSENKMNFYDEGSMGYLSPRTYSNSASLLADTSRTTFKAVSVGTLKKIFQELDTRISALEGN